MNCVLLILVSMAVMKTPLRIAGAEALALESSWMRLQMAAVMKELLNRGLHSITLALWWLLVLILSHVAFGVLSIVFQNHSKLAQFALCASSVIWYMPGHLEASVFQMEELWLGELSVCSRASSRVLKPLLVV